MGISVREWQSHFMNGDYSCADRDTQIAAGWFDWFCRDSSLAQKTHRMGKIISQIRDGGQINLDTTYVWFKNNCPLVGRLYDDFRFADMQTGKVIMTVCMRKGYEVYCSGHWDNPKVTFTDARHLMTWLNQPYSELLN